MKKLKKMLVRKDKLVQEMSQLLAEFYNNIRMKYMIMTDRHSKERKLLLNMQWKERKPCFPGEKKQKAKPEERKSCFPSKGKQKAKSEEQDTRTRKHEKLFLDDFAS